jgi:glycerol kinase
MQMQADQLGVPVERPRIADTTGMGAAFLAGLGTGVWSSQEEIASTWALERRFEPGLGAREAADPAYQQWLKAVERSKGWQEQPAG